MCRPRKPVRPCLARGHGRSRDTGGPDSQGRTLPIEYLAVGRRGETRDGAASCPFVAADLAERSSGWVDTDGNGFLDPWANGAYDWWDINGGDWLRYWGALSIAVVGASAVVLYALGQRQGRKLQSIG